MNAPLRILIDAKELIQRNGWCQLLSHDPFGRYCAMGAFEDSARPYNSADRHTALWCLRRSLPDTIGPSTISGFNDEPSTKEEHVLALFDKAIVKAKAL